MKVNYENLKSFSFKTLLAKKLKKSLIVKNI